MRERTGVGIGRFAPPLRPVVPFIPIVGAFLGLIFPIPRPFPAVEPTIGFFPGKLVAPAVVLREVRSERVPRPAVAERTVGTGPYVPRGAADSRTLVLNERRRVPVMVETSRIVATGVVSEAVAAAVFAGETLLFFRIECAHGSVCAKFTRVPAPRLFRRRRTVCKSVQRYGLFFTICHIFAIYLIAYEIQF